MITQHSGVKKTPPDTGDTDPIGTTPMTTPCPPDRRGIITSRPIPAWASHGPGPVAVLVWGPLLMIDPLINAAERRPAWLAWLFGLAILAAFAATVLAAYRDHFQAGRAVLAALAVQALLTFTATGLYGDHWYSLYILLALSIGAVAPPRWAPPAIIGLTLLGGTVTWWHYGNWTQTWTTVLPTFLAGFGTYSFHRLFTVIAELNATRQQLAAKAVDQERLRFSRDLHDLLGHTLSVIVVKAEAVRRMLPGNVEAARGHAVDIETIGRQALVEVREAVTGYRDADMAREISRAEIALAAAGIELRIDNRAEPVSPEVDTLFGWAVREGVTNVIRHSGARHCTIKLRSEPQQARLTVADDGNGSETAETAGGEGLRGLAERATLAGGTITTSRTPQGFVLTAEVPLRPDEETT